MRLLLLILLCAPCFAIAQSQLPNKVTRDERALKIGGIFDLTSDAGSLWGTAEKNAFLLAIKDFEAMNPIKVTPVLEDSAYSNSKSVSAFQKLTSVDDVKYVVGPTWEMFVATMPLCERNRIICLAPSNNSREFDNPNLRYSFTAYFRENGYSDVIADEVNRSGMKSSAIFATISPYADPQVENLIARLKKKPSAVNRVLPETRDFRSLIARLPASTDSIIVFLLNDGQLFAFLKQLSEIRKFRAPLFTDDSPIFDASFRQIDELGLDIRYSHQYFPEEVKSTWESKYQAAYGHAPEAPSASVCYDETMILLNCLKSNRDVDTVRACISNTKAYQGTSGTITFEGKQTAENRRFELSRLQ